MVFQGDQIAPHPHLTMRSFGWINDAVQMGNIMTISSTTVSSFTVVSEFRIVLFWAVPCASSWQKMIDSSILGKQRQCAFFKHSCSKWSVAWDFSSNCFKFWCQVEIICHHICLFISSNNGGRNDACEKCEGMLIEDQNAQLQKT